MTELEFKQKVLTLAQRAEQLLTERPHFPRAEPIYEQILRLVEEEPQHRGALCEVLNDLLARSAGPIELVEYVAHALRWPELKLAIQRLLAETQDQRQREALDRLLTAFNDDWDQRDIYRRWTGSKD